MKVSTGGYENRATSLRLNVALAKNNCAWILFENALARPHSKPVPLSGDNAADDATAKVGAGKNY